MRIKHVVLVVLTLFVSLAMALSMPTSARASSQYDNVVSSVNSVVVKEGMSSCTIDHTLTWATDVRGVLDATQQASFDSRAAWGVSLKEIPGDVIVAVVYWWEPQDLPSTATFDGDSLKVTPTREASMSVFHNGTACQADGFGSPTIHPTVVIAEHDSGSNTYPVRPFLLYGVNVDYPSGYEGELVASQYTPPPPTYVAMGDSFSSGEGNEPFEAGTDEGGVNECHRSLSAYPEWLSQTPSLSLDSYVSVACSGATTDNLLNGQWNEPAQVDALSTNTEVATITIGGNDVGFSSFATACVVGDCGSSTTVYSDTMESIDNDLPDKLANVLDTISDKTNDAKVYFVGYPYITPDLGLNNLPVQCSYLDSSSGPGQDSVAARAVVAELNSVISDTVDNYVNTESNSTFTFIDPNNSVDGTFDGHDVCAGQDAYFHNVTPNDVVGNGYRAKLFHPNVDGQYEYYSIVMGEIEAN